MNDQQLPDDLTPPDPLGARLRDALGPTQRARVPDDLVADTMAAVRGGRAGQRSPWRPGVMTWLGAVAASAVAVVIAATFLRSPTAVTPRPATPLPTGLATGTSEPAATPAPAVTPDGLAATPDPALVAPPDTSFPSTVLGLPVLDIAAAGARLGATDAREPAPLAIRGYLQLLQGASFCTFEKRSLLEANDGCVPAGYLTATPSGVPAAGVHFHAYPGAAWPRELPQNGAADGAAVVMIGHVADVRAADCLVARRAACSAQFVVDAIPWYDNLDVTTSHYLEAQGSLTVDVAALDAFARTLVPGGRTFGILSAAPDRLGALDQSFAAYPPPPVVGIATVVRMVTETGFVSVLVDGEQLTVYRPGPPFPLTVDGRAVTTVSEALAARDAAPPGTPLVVTIRGWFTMPALHPCPAPTIREPDLLPGCNPTWLAERREDLVSADGSWVGPSADNPVIAMRDRPSELSEARQPVAAVLVGHFHDAAAASTCSLPDRPACEGAFVLERVAWIDTTDAMPTATPGWSLSPSASTGPPGGDAPAWPATADGLPVISVAEAVARTPTTPGAGISLVAVHGWFSPYPPIPCPAPFGADALEIGCPDGFAWLTDDRQQLNDATFPSAVRPAGPALNPRFPGAAGIGGVPGTRAGGPPVPVVLVGHWGDGRAAACLPENAAACRQAFVVDGVAWVDGHPLDPLTAADEAARAAGLVTKSTASEVAGMAAVRLPASDGWTIAAIGATPAEMLTDLEPRSLALPALDRAAAMWLATLVRTGATGDEVRTLLVVDGTAAALALPDWSTRVAGTAPATVFTHDSAGRRIACVGVPEADCRTTAEAAVAAQPAPGGAAVTRLVVATVRPPWTAWSAENAGLDGIRYVEEVADGNTAGFLSTADGALVPVGGRAPAWVQAVVFLDP